MKLTQLGIVWDRAVASLHGSVDWSAAADFAGMAVVADVGPIAVNLEHVTNVDLAGLILLAELGAHPNVSIQQVPGPDRFAFGAHP